MSIRIPTYEQSTNVGGYAPNEKASGLRINNFVGDALGNVGKGFGDVESGMVAEEVANAHILRRQTEQDAQAYAGKALSDAHVLWQDNLQKRMETAPPAATGFTPGVLKDFDEWSKTSIDQAPTVAAKQYLSQHLISYRTQLAGQAMSFESQARVGWRTDEFTKSVDNWAITVSKDPSKFELAQSALNETLPNVGPLHQEKLRDYMRKALVQGTATGQIQTDPEHAYNLLMRSTLPANAGEARDKTGTIVPLPAGALPDWVAKIAQEEGADPRLVAALYAQESGSGANARTSVDGAVGGFQVMPSTFKQVMKGKGDINNPEDNARAGIRLISQLQNKYGVDPTLVGAAYFSGEGNVSPSGIINPNRTDGNGKSVKSYAADVGRRYAALDTGTRTDAGIEPLIDGAATDVKTGVPWVDAMSLQERLHYLQAADGEVRRRQQISRADLELKERDQNSQALVGRPIANPLTLPDYVRSYGQIDGPRRFGEYLDNQQFGANVQQVGTMTPQEQTMLLAKNTPVGNTPGFAQDQARFELLQRAVLTANKQRETAPMEFAAAHHLTTLNQIDYTSPKSISDEMSRRTITAGQNSNKWGVDYQVLTAGEADQLGQHLNALPAQDKATVLGQIYQSAGPDGLRSISAQLKDKNETLAIAGMLASRETTAGRNVAQIYLEGKEAVAQKRAHIDAKDESGIKANIYKEIDGVYSTPQARDAAADVAMGVYAKLKSEGRDDWKQALNISTGGLMDYNGAKIAKPYGWKDGQFRDAVTASGIAQVATAAPEFIVGQLRVPAVDFAKSLPGAKLQTYGDGTYMVKAGNDVVRLPSGKAFVLKVGP